MDLSVLDTKFGGRIAGLDGEDGLGLDEVKLGAAHALMLPNVQRVSGYRDVLAVGGAEEFRGSRSEI